MNDSATNLRSLLPLERCDSSDAVPTYADYCREERNFAAILYAQLLRPEGLQAFLRRIHGIGPIDHPEQAEVFFEYAHARDLWHRFGRQFDGKGQAGKAQREEGYRRAILALIDAPPGLQEITTTIAEFNHFFMGRGSKREIQMPNQWDQRRFGTWVELALDQGWYAQRAEALRFAERICCLKWAFNAKADIVIHLPEQRAVCVEIKVASGESKYSAKHGDDDAAAAFSMSQTELQRYVLESLLGYPTHFVFLTPGGGSGAVDADVAPEAQAAAESDGANLQTLDWAEVLQDLHADTSKPTELPFVHRMLDSSALQPKKRRGQP